MPCRVNSPVGSFSRSCAHGKRLTGLVRSKGCRCCTSDVSALALSTRGLTGRESFALRRPRAKARIPTWRPFRVDGDWRREKSDTVALPSPLGTSLTHDTHLAHRTLQNSAAPVRNVVSISRLHAR